MRYHRYTGEVGKMTIDENLEILADPVYCGNIA